MSKKVLIAESDNAVQQVVSYFLNLEGFEVATAGDGVSALEMTERISPEVILLNPNLSGINGIEVSRLIHDKAEYKDVPILFLADEMAGGSIPSGFGIINKPIDPARLVDTIREYSHQIQQTPPQEHEEANEACSIEELLGWDVSAEKEADTEDGVTPSVDESLESIFAQEESVVSDLTESLEDTGDEPQMERAEDGLGAGSEGDAETIEADLRNRITDDMIENMIRRIASEITERVAVEIVPKIAEMEIKKEIERIKSEGE